MTPATRLLGALFVAELVSAMETSMLFPALKTLVAEFGNPADVGWVITAYSLVGAGGAAVAGRLGDLFGRRRVLLIILALAAAGALVSASSAGLTGIIAGRSLQGVAAAILPLCFGLVRENLPESRISFGTGLVVAAVSLGTAIGLSAGGWIVDHDSWRTIFVSSAILAAIATILVAAFVPQSKLSAPDDSVGMAEGLLFLPGVAGLLLAITKCSVWGWRSIATLGLTAASILLLGAWLWLSLARAKPLINIQLFRNRAVLVGNLAMALASLGLFQGTQISAILMQQPRSTGIGLGLSATLAGGISLIPQAVALVAAMATGTLVARTGSRNALVVAGITALTGWTVIAFGNAYLVVLIIGLCWTAAASSMVYTAIPLAIMASVPSDRTSESTGLTTVFRATFFAAGTQLVIVTLASSTRPAGSARFPAPEAYTMVFSGMFGLGLAMLAAVLFLDRDIGQTARLTIS